MILMVWRLGGVAAVDEGEGGRRAAREVEPVLEAGELVAGDGLTRLDLHRFEVSRLVED